MIGKTLRAKNKEQWFLFGNRDNSQSIQIDKHDHVLIVASKEAEGSYQDGYYPTWIFLHFKTGLFSDTFKIDLLDDFEEFQ